MKRSSVFTLLVAAPLVAGANEARSSFVVTVQVAPRAQLETIAEPAGFEVSVEDATRGYVDVTALYRVRNNDPAGYVVRLEPRVGLAASVEVAGLASPVVMRDEVVEVTEPAALAARDLNLRYRIVLGAGVPPGVYALPVRLTVATL